MKVLFVCLGNICRSPLAEGIMLHLNEQHKLGWEIDSAGTANYHVGEAPDARSTANAAKHGINLLPLRARQFKATDFKHFDHIFVMDKSNLQNVLRLCDNENERKKVKLFLEFTGHASLVEVPDPYYSGAQGFEDVFQMVHEACTKLIAILDSKK